MNVEAGIMKCTKCGRTIRDDAKVCIFCGKPVDVAENEIAQKIDEK